uniref:Protein ASX-like PHD domain-containing protein n=1 Tax=Anopheles christyi TaxID=43041 RepID=A0A182KBI4_9DIPT
MATPAIGQQQQAQQRPRLPLQRTQFGVQPIQQQQQQQQQQTPQQFQQQQQQQQQQPPPKALQQIAPTQSQQRFQQKYVTNQLIRGQNAFLMNNVHHLQQQTQQQVATTVGANVIVGATGNSRSKRANEASSGAGATGNGTTTGNGNVSVGGGGGSGVAGGGSSSGSGSSSGGGKRGGRSSSSRLPPGAVNLERSYQICQAVIQNSPNRHQLKAQLKSPQAFLAASNSNSNSSISSIGSTGSSSSSSSSSSGVSASSIIGNNTKEDAHSGSNSSGGSNSAFSGVLGFGGNKVSRLLNTKRTVSAGARQQQSPIVVRQVYASGAGAATSTPSVVNASAAGAASQSNPISIITAPQSQQQQLHTLGEQLQQHGQQIISVSAAPSIVHATAASNNNGTIGGNVNVGTGGAPSAPASAGAAAAGNFGGKYVLVQRAAHIGEIVTPRAASAPPTHNQDAHLIEPPVASASSSGSNADISVTDTSGGTAMEDGTGATNAVVYMDSPNALMAELQHQHQPQQQQQQQHAFLDSCGNGAGGSSVVVMNGVDAMDPAGANEIADASRPAEEGTGMLVSPSGMSPRFNDQMIGAGHMGLFGGGYLLHDTGNHISGGVEPSPPPPYIETVDGSVAVQPHQQQEIIFSTENDIDTLNCSSPAALDGGSADDDGGGEERDGTAEPIDGNVEDCACSLNAMVICQQCGAFCHDDCVSATKLFFH